MLNNSNQDDVFLPRVNSKLLTNAQTFNLISGLNLAGISDRKSLHQLLNLESSCSLSYPDQSQNHDIELYLARLRSQVSDPIAAKLENNFIFSMGFYLSSETMDLISNEFERVFNTENSSLKENGQLVIKVLDYTYKNFTYSFLFQDQNEINYAKNLIKIYRILFKDFHQRNKNVLSEFSSQYSRYFYLAGNLTWHRTGKTVHNTNNTMMLNQHGGDGFSQKISINQGILSHFRVEYMFNSMLIKHVSIRELALDLNYFYCYYRHVLKHFSSLDVLQD